MESPIQLRQGEALLKEFANVVLSVRIRLSGAGKFAETTNQLFGGKRASFEDSTGRTRHVYIAPDKQPKELFIGTIPRLVLTNKRILFYGASTEGPVNLLAESLRASKFPKIANWRPEPVSYDPVFLETEVTRRRTEWQQYVARLDPKSGGRAKPDPNAPAPHVTFNQASAITKGTGRKPRCEPKANKLAASGWAKLAALFRGKEPVVRFEPNESPCLRIDVKVRYETFYQDAVPGSKVVTGLLKAVSGMSKLVAASANLKQVTEWTLFFGDSEQSEVLFSNVFGKIEQKAGAQSG